MRVRAWVGTVVFLVLAPGVVAGLIPGVITGWRIPRTGGWVPPVAIVAAVVILSGVTVLLDAFVRFARADGTPAPPMPTVHLVVVGPYRHVRNPMYLAVLAIILGQALLFGSGGALLYAGMVLLAVALFVRGYEEPTLELEYGDEYREYRRNVRGWIPRVRPWQEASQPPLIAPHARGAGRTAPADVNRSADPRGPGGLTGPRRRGRRPVP